MGRLAVNQTILKARIAAATSSQYVYVGSSRRNKIPCCSAYTISEKAMQFWHPDYNVPFIYTYFFLRHAYRSDRLMDFYAQ